MTVPVDTANIRAFLANEGKVGFGPMTCALPADMLRALCDALDQARENYRVAHHDAVVNARTVGGVVADRDLWRSKYLALDDEFDRLQAPASEALDRVRALHNRRHAGGIGDFCDACCPGIGDVWPCPTIAALEGVDPVKPVTFAESGSEPLTDWQREFLAKAEATRHGDLCPCANCKGEPLADWERDLLAGTKPAEAQRQNLERRLATAEFKGRMLAKAIAERVAERDSHRDAAIAAEDELDDANALLLDVAGELWDAEKRADMVDVARLRVLGRLGAAQKVLNDTNPYRGSLTSRVEIDKVAEGITARIAYFKGEMTLAETQWRDRADELVAERRAADGIAARLEVDRDKWKRIAAEIAADHLGESA